MSDRSTTLKLEAVVVMCGCAIAPWRPVCEHRRAAYAAQAWRRPTFIQPPPMPRDPEDDE